MNLKKYKLTAFTLAITAVLAFTGCSSTTEQTTEAQTTEVSTDAAEPPVNPASGDSSNESGSFSTLNTTDLDGNPVDSSLFSENKLTFLNAWNIGCGPCIQEIPALGQLYEEYKEKGVAIRGLYYNFNEEMTDKLKKEIQDVLSKANVNYPQLLTTPEMMGSAPLNNLMVFPTTYVVDSEGNVIDTIESADSYEGWKSVIDSYLEQVEADA